MKVIYACCAGLDVHKKLIVACVLVPGPDGQLQTIIRVFGAMTADLLALGDWLHSLGVTTVAMESTGEYWKPVYNLLEGQFELLVVNARHIKNVPGRKTDVKDAEWIANLLRHGLLRPSFIPPQPQRDLRDLTRQRTNLVQDRASVVNRLQKVLEWANLKLSAVVGDITGASARAMLEALLGGEHDPAVLAELARGRLRAKRDLLAQALTGQVREHHCFIIAEHLVQLDNLDEQIGRFDAQIEAYLTRLSTPPAAATPATEATPTAETTPVAPTTDAAPAAEAAPAPAASTAEAAAAVEAASTAEAAATVEAAPTAETALVTEAASTAPAAPVTEAASTAEAAPTVEAAPATVAAPTAEAALVTEAASTAEAAPAAPATEAAPATDAAPLTWNAAIALADTIPGIGVRLAQDILAEIGIDMSRFPTAGHLASWAKLCPGHNESAGKRFAAAIGHGNRHLRAKLTQAAWAAIKVKDSYFAACFHRLAGRRGVKRAIIAIAHRILIALYHILRRREPFRDLGGAYHDQRSQAQLIARTERRFARLGLKLTVEPLQPAA